MRILLVFDGALDLVWSDELLLTVSLNDNVRIGLDEDEDDNLDDESEALDDVVGGDDVLEVDQDTGCSASTILRWLCLKYWEHEVQSSELISCFNIFTQNGGLTVHLLEAWLGTTLVWFQQTTIAFLKK